MGLPPVATSSPLIAVFPKMREPDPSETVFGSPTSVWETAKDPVFDVCELSLALSRSQQQSSSASGLRRTVSAPQALDSLANIAGDEREYLPPSGGPLRRVASSLSMRRSASFCWSPAAQHEFERAVASLNARHIEVSAVAVLRMMRHHPDLKLADVEKHMSRKRLVHNKLLLQLDRAPLKEAAVVEEASAVPRPPALDDAYASPPACRPSGRFSGAATMPAVDEEKLLQEPVFVEGRLAALHMRPTGHEQPRLPR